MIITKLSEILEGVPHHVMRSNCPNRPAHSAVLRLLFMTLLFLSKYAENGDIIVFNGAPSPPHIIELAKLFPECSFEVWNKEEIDGMSGINIVNHGKVLTADDAKMLYKKNNKKILFVSSDHSPDIYMRDGHTKDEVDSVIMGDMQAQMDMCKIINPRKAFLRFQLPWTDERYPSTQKYPYLKGTRYLQLYSPAFTVTVLSTSDYETMEDYDADDYNGKIMAHLMVNVCISPMRNRWTDLIKEHGLDNRWDNIYALYITNMYLSRKDDYPGDTEEMQNKALELFLKLVKSQDTEGSFVNKTVFAADSG